MELNNSVYFVQNGASFIPKKELDSVIHKKLPGGNYSIKSNPNIGYYLEKIEDFRPQGRIYGDAHKNAERIFNSFKHKQNNLGVVLFGEKGSGKTLLGRLISLLAAKEDIPTIFITSPMTGEPFFQFLYSIQQECIVFIDEYEKIYDNKEQEEMLTVLDGVFQSKKMFIITCNDRWKLDSHLRNRPGRVHYLIEFDGLAPAFIREFCQENLKDKSRVNEVVQICGLFSTINFDMLQALVWEMNLYNEGASDAIKLLNAKPESDDYSMYDVTVSIVGDNKLIGNCSPAVARGSPLKEQSKTVSVAVKKEDFSPEVWTTLVASGKLSDEYGDILAQEEIRTGKYGKGNSDAGEDIIFTMVIPFTLGDLRSVNAETGAYTFIDKLGNKIIYTRQKLTGTSVQDVYSRLM